MQDKVQPMLQVKGLKKYFGGLKAVDGVSFDVYRGETLGIIGPNGAGKTTLFNTLCGVYKPDDGQVLLDGKPAHGLKPHEIVRLRVARTFQISHPFKDMTVLDNVVMALGGDNYRNVFKAFCKSHTPRNMEKARAALERVGIFNYQYEKAGQLSLGFLRKLEIARVLVLEPVLLMLDEPCAGLGQDSTEEFIELMFQLKEEGITLMMVEHNMPVAMNVCDRLVVFSYGQKIAEGTPQEVRSDPYVIEAYLGKDDEIA